MELELYRTYFPNGTNGEISLNGVRVCSTIELAWKNNQYRISCIPEGKYELTKRYSPKFGHHLLVMNVKDRELILMHPANDAVKELKGCIAPVSILAGEGKGNNSRLALKKLLALVYVAMERKEKVFLTVKSDIR
ncbi:MAG: DUF5675 family protein [Lacibacter sp.]